MPRYVQPVARHLVFPERYLLRAKGETWLVWSGDDAGAEPEEIPAAVARWLLTRSWIVPLAEEGAWVHVDDLPLVPDARPTPRQ